MMTKLKNSNGDKTKKKSNCDKNQKLLLWQNLKKTNVVTKLKLWQNSNCDKTPIVTKLKMWQNSNCDKTQKSKIVHLLKTQIVMKLKTQIVMKLENSNCEKNSKAQNVTKLKLWQNSNCDRTQKPNGDKTQKLEFFFECFSLYFKKIQKWISHGIFKSCARRCRNHDNVTMISSGISQN